MSIKNANFSGGFNHCVRSLERVHGTVITDFMQGVRSYERRQELGNLLTDIIRFIEECIEQSTTLSSDSKEKNKDMYRTKELISSYKERLAKFLESLHDENAARSTLLTHAKNTASKNSNLVARSSKTKHLELVEDCFPKARIDQDISNIWR